ncbi:MAG: polysaccharide lyase [Fibrobacteria bacterium]
MKFLLAILTLASLGGATALPFQDNLNALDSTCWYSQPNGDQNTAGCGQWKELGMTRFNGFHVIKARPSLGVMECTYMQTEDECRAQIQIGETDSIWTQFDIKYASNFDFGPGMKIMRWNAYGWTDHIMYTYSGSNHAGITDMTGLCAEPNGGSGQYGCVGMSFPRNKWIRIKNFLKMNTPGQSNGVFKLWVNDTLRINNTTAGNFRTTSHGFDKIAFGGWYSGPGNENPSNPDTYWIDNPRISLTNDFSAWPSDTTTQPPPPPPPPPAPPSGVVYDTSWAMSADSVYYRIVTTRNIRTIGVTQPIRSISSTDTTLSRDTTQVN